MADIEEMSKSNKAPPDQHAQAPTYQYKDANGVLNPSHYPSFVWEGGGGELTEDGGSRDAVDPCVTGQLDLG